MNCLVQNKFSMKIDKQFKIFCDNIQVGDARQMVIDSHIHGILECLNRKLCRGENGATIIWNSLGRGTSACFSNFVRLMYIIPHRFFSDDKGFPQQLVESSHVALSSLCSKVFINQVGNGITIAFEDGFTFEVIPCFENYDYSLRIYKQTNISNWTYVYPRRELAAVQYMENVTNGNYSKICRMVRAWSHTNCVSLCGIFLDTIVFNFLNDYIYRDWGYGYYDWLSRDLFKYISLMPHSRIKAMGSNRIISNQGNFQEKATIAYKKTLEAIALDKNENFDESNKKWREIYGDAFPLNMTEEVGTI